MFLPKTSLVAVLSIASLACSPKGKDSDSSDPNATETGTGAGTIAVDQKTDTNTDTSTMTGLPEIDLFEGEPQALAEGDDNVTAAGVLAIPAASLVSALPYDTVFALPIIGTKPAPGSMADATLLSVKVGDDGKFKIDLPRVDPLLAKLATIYEADGTIDPEAFITFLDEAGETPSEAEAEQIRTASQEDLAAYADNIKNGGDDEGEAREGANDRSYVLVAANTSSGGRPAIASSFFFIGLKSGTDNFFNLPATNAKTSLPLGVIKPFGDGDDAAGTLPLSSDLFKFSDAELAQMAAVSGTLKSVKNAYLNGDLAGSYDAEPFFVFQGTLATGADGVATVLTPEILKYNGYGIYLNADHPGLTSSHLCKSGSGPGALIEFAPPADYTIWTYEEGSTPEANLKPSFSVLSNSDVTPVTINDDCGSQGLNNNNMFYGQVRADDTRMSFNWGGNGAFKAYSAANLDAPTTTGIPPGLWTLKINETASAWFDLKAAEPVDPEGNPLVFLPKVTITTAEVAGKRQIKTAKVEMYFFDRSSGETGAFVKLDDLKLFNRLISETPRLDLDDYGGYAGNGHARLSMGVTAVANADKTALEFDLADARDNDDQPVTMPVYYFDTCNGATPADFDDSVAVAESIAFSYKMFGNSYRIDFRAGCGG